MLKNKEEKILWYEETFIKKVRGRFLAKNSEVYKFLEENKLFDLLEKSKKSKSLQFLKQELYIWAYEEIPVCKKCGKPARFFYCTAKYSDYCSSKCAHSSEESKQRRKETCLKLFGVENAFKSNEKKEKIKQTCLERYGVDNPAKSEYVKKKIEETCKERYDTSYIFQSKEFREKSRRTCLEKYGTENPYQSKEIQEKYKQTCLERYGVDNPTKSKQCKEKSKQTCLERYGVDCYVRSEKYQEDVPSIIKKQYLSKKQNNTFICSKPENEIFEMLKKKFPNVQRNFKSDKYPFACDFYIPNIDLYIEFQGHWTHEKEPFDPNNENHKNIVNKWKLKASECNFKNESKNMYLNAIKIWTIKDVEKRAYAKKNNLNWIEFFTLEEATKYIESL